MSELHGRSVVVTGAGGFIGGHLTAALVRAGASVRAFLRYNSRNDRGTLNWFGPEVSTAVEAILGDLRDIESVSRAIAGTELVFHLGPALFALPRRRFNSAMSLVVAAACLLLPPVRERSGYPLTDSSAGSEKIWRHREGASTVDDREKTATTGWTD